MEVTTLLLASALCIVVFFIFYLRDAEAGRIRHYINLLPGPPAVPILGSVYPLLLTSRSERWDVVMNIHKKFGPLFRWWIGSHAVVTITQPEHVEAVLSSTQIIEKSQFYKFLHPWLGTGLLTSTGSKWHAHRKIITPSFHFKILDNFIEVFSEKSEILVQKLKRETGGPGFNVWPYISRCALDIICETAMGTCVHAQDDESSEYVTAVYDMSFNVSTRMLVPWLHPDFLFKLSSTGRAHERNLRTLHGFSGKVIQERKSQRQISVRPEVDDEEKDLGKKRRVAFLDMLLEASEGGAKLTDEDIREEVDTFMFEGHDTTTAGMCWTLFLLGLHPAVQSKTYEEQESIFQGSDRSATMKDLNEMKYLERVIKESLRLYPSVPGISRALMKDIELGGYTIPAGVSLDVSINVIHRNPEQFPDPEKFDPDNFLPERVVKRHPYAYIPFSAGPRNCIGQKFALLEEKTVLSYVLRHYELRSLDKMEDIEIEAELILKSHNGVKLCVTPRGTV